MFGAEDWVTGDEFQVVRCAQCGLARTSPQPPIDELDRYYTPAYHRASKRYRFGLDRILQPVHRRRIDRIERLTGGPGRVLDVGCGPGWFLDQMRRRGWETRGTERSASAAEQARQTLNLDVRSQELEELVAEGESFDAVVLWHVAEHLHDPAAALYQISQLLRPGGVLMIGVPNFGSPEARVGRAGWFHLDVPRHLFHFTLMTLQRLLADSGFEARDAVYIAPEYDVFSFVQTAENFIGLPTNLLYNVLRRTPARLADSRPSWSLSALAVAAAIPLTLAGLIWIPAAAALGLSATVTVFAVRPPELKIH